MDALFNDQWQKGGIPDLWDGKAAGRIINRLIEIGGKVWMDRKTAGTPNRTNQFLYGEELPLYEIMPEKFHNLIEVTNIVQYKLYA